MTKKIGIITLQFANNYGGLLQTYALSTVIKGLGYTPIIINRLLPLQSGLFSRIRLLMETFTYASFRDFRNNFLINITNPIHTDSDFEKNIDVLDAVIVGSDQVWRLEYTKDEGLGLNMFLDFVPDNIKKISYAASFGKDTFEGDATITKKVKTLLMRFNAISVREDSGVSICKTIFDIDSTHVLDPTMLLVVTDYDKIIGDYALDIKGKFISYYFLDNSTEKMLIVDEFARHLNTKKNNIYRGSSKHFSLKKDIFPTKKFRYPSFKNWLFGIKNAELVIADSFHGIVFSILYNKEFICIANKSRGVSRMISLLKMFGLENRLVYETTQPSEYLYLSAINYDLVNKKLEDFRKKSFLFLKEALK